MVIPIVRTLTNGDYHSESARPSPQCGALALGAHPPAPTPTAPSLHRLPATPNTRRGGGCTVCPQRRTHGGAGAACYAHLRATPFVALARNSPPSPPTGSRPLTRATHSGLHRLPATPNTRRGGGCVLRAPAGYALCRARSQLPALAPYGVAPANAGDALGAAYLNTDLGA